MAIFFSHYGEVLLASKIAFKEIILTALSAIKIPRITRMDADRQRQPGVRDLPMLHPRKSAVHQIQFATFSHTFREFYYLRGRF
jgi:hypothetical protein